MKVSIFFLFFSLFFYEFDFSCPRNSYARHVRDAMGTIPVMGKEERGMDPRWMFAHDLLGHPSCFPEIFAPVGGVLAEVG